MTVHLAIRPLSQWIRAVCQADVKLSASHLRFMQTTFGTVDIPDIFAQGQSCEIDSFLELIFFPDTTMRLYYEAHWGERRFNADDIRALSAQLSHHPVQARIMAGPQAPVQNMELSDSLLASLVHRLKITWQPSPAVEEALQRIQPAAQRTAIRAELRQAPLAWHNGQAALAARFMETIPVDDENFAPLLSELIDLLAEMSPGQSAEAFFLARKSACLRCLCRAEDFERRRQTQAMEVMMMQGERAVHGSAAHWRERMTMIDRLSRAFFGTIPFIAIPEEYQVEIDGY